MRTISMLGAGDEQLGNMGVHILGALVNRHFSRRSMDQIAQGQDMHPVWWIDGAFPEWGEC